MLGLKRIFDVEVGLVVMEEDRKFGEGYWERVLGFAMLDALEWSLSRYFYRAIRPQSLLCKSSSTAYRIMLD
jgi:hypothetical protein